MSNVVEFKPKTTPHGEGEAFSYKFAHAPSVGTSVRECDCGNRLFFITPEGHMCANCGTYQRY